MTADDPNAAPAGEPDRSENEARLESVIQSAMDAIITVDETQRVVVFNHAAERIFGVPASEAIGAPLDRFIPERFRRAHAQHVRAFGHAGSTMRAMGRLGSISGLRADGTEFPIEASISQAVVGRQRLFTVILRDISQRRHLEELLLQAQKMEGIGRLSAGVAHDFNNLLMAISNYLALANNRLPKDHAARQPIAHAQEAVDRAAMFTRRLLMFARKQSAHPREVSLAEIVRGIEPMLRRMVGDAIAVRADVAPDTGFVRADPVQIEQIVMNLVVNARDAMPRGGTLTLACGNTVVGPHDPDITESVPPGPYVALTVTDTGTGMTPDIMARLFEPFFTTKPPENGTGLGLATCHGIVRRAGGTIAVRSSPGSGSSFRVLLPRVPLPGADATTERTEPAAGTETVLLIDDSGVVRDLAASALRAAGYTVLPAASPDEGLRLARSHLGPIDLLLTSAAPEGANGSDLVESLRRTGAPLAILYLSDPSTGSHAGQTCDPRDGGVLARPFSEGALLRSVRAAIDALAEKKERED